jgi:hypothetical protein
MYFSISVDKRNWKISGEKFMQNQINGAIVTYMHSHSVDGVDGRIFLRKVQ